jgi:hypothetical protein
MRLPTFLRNTAALTGALLLIASATTPTLAASAANSIVPIGALDGAWTTVSSGADTTNQLDNYSVTYQRADGITAQVSLIVLPSADMAQQVVQTVIDSTNKGKPAGVSVLPTVSYGDANAYLIAGTYSDQAIQGRIFVDKGTVVTVMVAGNATASDDITAAADALAGAQDSILPSNA